jgi:hypothetical protein
MHQEAGDAAQDPLGAKEFRQVLTRIIGLFEGGASVNLRNTSISNLIERAMACDLPPRQLEILLQEAFEGGDSFFEERDRLKLLTEACESWHRELSGRRLLASSNTAQKGGTTAHVKIPEKSRPLSIRTQAANQPWTEAVKSVREGLLGLPSSGLGSVWEMPRKVWSSPWIEAYRVSSFSGEDERQGLVLVPTDAAGNSKEAESWWRLKVEAAQKLKAQARPDDRLAKVIDHGTHASPSFVLLEWDPPCGSLLDYVATKQSRTLRDEVEIALAWCELLASIGRRGILVVDLPPALIHLRCSAGQRSLFLADPTAVIPASHLLPELRSSRAIPSCARYRTANRDQVFLVGALLLTCVRRQMGVLQGGISTSGPSASLASLSGLPGLSTRLPSEVLPSIHAYLEKHPKPSGVNVSALCHALRWSLAESGLERPANLEKLSADLSASLL